MPQSRFLTLGEGGSSRVLRLDGTYGDGWAGFVHPTNFFRIVSFLEERSFASLFVTFVSFIRHFRLLVFSILVTLVVWFSFRFFLSCPFLLQNVNKDYVIFLYFHNFVAKSDQKPKMKNGMNETFVMIWLVLWTSTDIKSLEEKRMDSLIWQHA